MLDILAFNAMAEKFSLSYFFNHDMTSNSKMIKICNQIFCQNFS